MTHTNTTRLDLDAANGHGFVWRLCQVLQEPAVRKAWYKVASVFAAEIEAVSQAVGVTRKAWHRYV
mgnify:CR=1 FL=1